MLKDAFDPANMIQVSTYAIRLFGLGCAIYCCELHVISQKADRKKKKNGGGYFTKEGYLTLNRDYIKHRTTLTAEEQYKFDSALKKVGIMEVSEKDPDNVKFDSNLYLQIMANDDCKFLEKVTKQVKTPSAAETKAIALQKKINSLKSVVIEDNATITDLIYTWIDELAPIETAKMTTTTVKEFQKMVMDYAKSSVKVASRIIQIATAQKWLNAVYAIENYEREVKLLKNNQPKASKLKVATKESVNDKKKY